MDRLPMDIVMEVLSRLPIKSLMRCRCVCKLWLNLTLHRSFINLHLNRSSLQTNPNFILTSTICINAFFFHTQMYFLQHDETQNDYTCCDVYFSQPNFVEFKIMGSCNGLLCLVHRMNGGIIYVCNPFTRHHVKLPDPISPSQLKPNVVIGFGFNPKTNQYKVVEIVHMLPQFYVYTLGDNSWRVKGNTRCAASLSSPSVPSVNGALHWAGLYPSNCIVTFDIADEVVGVIPRPEVGVRNGNYSLGVLSGCLMSTEYSFEDRIEIWVMKQYGVKESWTKFFAVSFNLVGWNIKFIRTLSLQNNGELLMTYNNRDLVSYNPQTMTWRKLSIVGLPSWFEAFSHVESLLSPPGCLRNNRQY